MINKVILIGNLGRDPEVRTTQGGTAVATLSVATSERVKDKSGEWVDHTEWHRVVVFGRTAENAGRFLRKGRQVFVEGKIRTNKWKDQQGQDRYTTEILADNLRFIGAGRESGSGDLGGGTSGDLGGGGGSSYSTAGATSGGGVDDDIPF